MGTSGKAFSYIDSTSNTISLRNICVDVHHPREAWAHTLMLIFFFPKQSSTRCKYPSVAGQPQSTLSWHAIRIRGKQRGGRQLRRNRRDLELAEAGDVYLISGSVK